MKNRCTRIVHAISQVWGELLDTVGCNCGSNKAARDSDLEKIASLHTEMYFTGAGKANKKGSKI